MVILLVSPIEHNIKCWPLSHLLLNRGHEKKPISNFQSLLVGALKQTHTRYKWPDHGHSLTVFLFRRVLVINFLEDNYVSIYQPGSPLVFKKKVFTFGDLVKAWVMYQEWQAAYELSCMQLQFKKQPLQINISAE